MSGFGYRVETLYNTKTGSIEQITEPYGPDYDLGGMVRDVYRRVIETQDAQIRQALINLGWTPPLKDRSN